MPEARCAPSVAGIQLSRSEIAYVTLALVPGIGRARLEVLLASFGSAESVLQAGFRHLIAVPSILMVAPSGRTKLDTPLDTPSSSRAALIVAGSVPELLVVVKATAAGFVKAAQCG